MITISPTEASRLAWVVYNSLPDHHIYFNISQQRAVRALIDDGACADEPASIVMLSEIVHHGYLLMHEAHQQVPHYYLPYDDVTADNVLARALARSRHSLSINLEKNPDLRCLWSPRARDASVSHRLPVIIAKEHLVALRHVLPVLTTLTQLITLVAEWGFSPNAWVRRAKLLSLVHVGRLKHSGSQYHYPITVDTSVLEKLLHTASYVDEVHTSFGWPISQRRPISVGPTPFLEEHEDNSGAIVPSPQIDEPDHVIDVHEMDEPDHDEIHEIDMDDACFEELSNDEIGSNSSCYQTPRSSSDIHNDVQHERTLSANNKNTSDDDLGTMMMREPPDDDWESEEADDSDDNDGVKGARAQREVDFLKSIFGANVMEEGLFTPLAALEATSSLDGDTSTDGGALLVEGHPTTVDRGAPLCTTLQVRWGLRAIAHYCLRYSKQHLTGGEVEMHGFSLLCAINDERMQPNLTHTTPARTASKDQQQSSTSEASDEYHADTSVMRACLRSLPVCNLLTLHGKLTTTRLCVEQFRHIWPEQLLLDDARSYGRRVRVELWELRYPGTLIINLLRTVGQRLFTIEMETMLEEITLAQFPALKAIPDTVRADILIAFGRTKEPMESLLNMMRQLAVVYASHGGLNRITNDALVRPSFMTIEEMARPCCEWTAAQWETVRVSFARERNAAPNRMLGARGYVPAAACW